jgi:hypothetical protein
MTAMPGDRSQDDETPVSAAVAAAGEELVRAIRSHAAAVASADEAAARAARAAIQSAMSKYSGGIDDGWNEVPPFPVPRTLRERDGRTPKEIFLRVAYHLQVFDRDRLLDIAEEVSDPLPDIPEAAAALYGAQLWVPSEESGLAHVAARYSGRFGQA